VHDIIVLTTTISCDCTEIASILRFSTLRAEDTVYFFPLSFRVGILVSEHVNASGAPVGRCMTRAIVADLSHGAAEEPR